MAASSKSLSARAVWKNALKSAADPERASHYLRHFEIPEVVEKLAAASDEQARTLSALFNGSAALSELLLARPEWIETALKVEDLACPRRRQGLQQEVNDWLMPAIKSQDFSGGLRQLRDFKQKEMLRIALRDLAGFGEMPEIIQEISDVADVCLDSVYQICWQKLTARFGFPFHQDANNNWLATRCAVLGLGKLGGQELNYSSDVDVVFVYAEEGCVFKSSPKRKAPIPDHALSNHMFFTRLAEAFIAEVRQQTGEGMLYRIDLRLRPEGDTGPLARSLESYENYYAQWGQTWERMMLIKTRHVAGDPSVAGEFVETIQTFRYPRSLSETVMGEIRRMKQRIESEVVRAGEMERNVKLGRGGIREIEFIVQALQLIKGGQLPFLQTAQTLPGLEQLERYKLLTARETEALRAAYCFLRQVEHRLQMEQNLQTHSIPEDAKACGRLAALMGFKNWEAFNQAHRQHADEVRAIYDKLLQSDAQPKETGLLREFKGRESEWQEWLAQRSFKDVDRSLRLIEQFVHGPGFVHVSPRTTELAWQILPKFFTLCRKTGTNSTFPPGVVFDPASKDLSDPDRVLARLDSFINAYGARSTLFEMWAHHPSLFELLILLFDRSEFLAESAIRAPDLVDELMLSDRLRRGKAPAEVLRDLRYGLKDKDQRQWMRRYHHAEFMRIGLRDILGLADLEQVHQELTGLADACLQYALEVSLRKHRLKQSPFVVIGLGKLGGMEIDYGSDLDVVFVADDKARNLPKLQQIAVDVVDLLSAKTDLGAPFILDARLRPDGEAGLLVNTLSAYEDYYRQRALLWEIQTLTRSRPAAGNTKLGERFQALAARLTNFRKPSLPLAAYNPEWRRQIDDMRRRIEKERTASGQEELAIKTGAGGMIDAEFIAQTLCLEQGWQEANTLRALVRAREIGVFARRDADRLITHYRHLRHVGAILRRWSFEGETVLPAKPEAYYRVSVRCGWATVEDFQRQLAASRKVVREVYRTVFPELTP